MEVEEAEERSSMMEWVGGGEPLYSDAFMLVQYLCN